MGKARNIIGERFGRLIVLAESERLNGKATVICLCDCGNTKIVRKTDLTCGKTKSCGCLRQEITAALGRSLKSQTVDEKRLKNIYYHMKRRCYDENDKGFHNYGERGITICDEWMDSENGLNNFIIWALENGYEKSLSIDRINNDDIYSPTNCKWSTIKEQSNNTRLNRKIDYYGNTYTLTQLAEKLELPRDTVKSRINSGWDISLWNIPQNNKIIRRNEIVNSVTIMGRATADAELRHTQSDVPVTSFTLAVDRGFKDENGNREVDFLDIVAWRNNATFASKYVTKGRQFAVVGKLQTRSWTDKDGNKRKSVEIVADNIYFADSKKTDNTSEESGY